MKQIAEKILKIMADIGYIQKDGKNKFQNYSYVSESAAVTAIREAMIKHRVVAFPRVTAHNVIEAGTTSKGAQQFLTTTLTTYQFVDVDSGESVEVSLVGQGIDSGDKGAYKAATGVNKYVLMKVFQLATGDDPEKDEQFNQTKKAAPKPFDREKALKSIEAMEGRLKLETTHLANARKKHAGDTVLDECKPDGLRAYYRYLDKAVKEKVAEEKAEEVRKAS